MIQTVPDGVIIDVRVVRRAWRSGPVWTRGAALLVRLCAPPADGEANADLVEVTAAVLVVPKRAVAIVAGERSRRKRVRVSGGIDLATAESRLARRN